jgi:predicted nucleotidyltransferase
MISGPREQLAQRLAADLAGRPEVVAVAITGSFARGTTWEGSDVDPGNRSIFRSSDVCSFHLQ